MLQFYTIQLFFVIFIHTCEDIYCSHDTLYQCLPYLDNFVFSLSPQVVWRKLGDVVPGFKPDLS